MLSSKVKYGVRSSMVIYYLDEMDTSSPVIGALHDLEVVVGGVERILLAMSQRIKVSKDEPRRRLSIIYFPSEFQDSGEHPACSERRSINRSTHVRVWLILVISSAEQAVS